jgi:hypothetical protein
MDVFDEELLRFWKIASQFNLKYIMIGGVATNLHGYQRTTEDIDLWIEDSTSNRKNLRKVFREYGIGDLKAIANMQFVPGWTYFYLNNGIRLDVMTSVKGLDESFDNYFKLASIASIYDIEIPFLHINHLISSKKAANRSKDQIDIIELEKIRRIMEDEQSHK